MQVGTLLKRRLLRYIGNIRLLCAENNALDFDDLIVKTVELFSETAEMFWKTIRKRFRYIMVDEYQDTNTAQFKFISLLASKI